MPSPSAGEPTPSEAASPSDGDTGATPSASPSDAPSASPPVAALVDGDVAIVPVVDFRSATSAVTGSEVRALADGGEAFANVVLVEADADGILAALRLDRGALGDRLKTVPSRDALAARLSRQKDDLGFLRADEVGPDVRAIGWGSDALFGVDRVKSLANWPLHATLQVPEGEPPAYDPEAGVDDGRRRRRAARPGRQARDRRPRRGHRLPVQRGLRRHHRHLQGLLAVRLGHAVHEARRPGRRRSAT